MPPWSGAFRPEDGNAPRPSPEGSGQASDEAAKSYSGDCVHGIGLLLWFGDVKIQTRKLIYKM